jgi:hypothetical protein
MRPRGLGEVVGAILLLRRAIPVLIVGGAVQPARVVAATEVGFDRIEELPGDAPSIGRVGREEAPPQGGSTPDGSIVERERVADRPIGVDRSRIII